MGPLFAGLMRWKVQAAAQAAPTVPQPVRAHPDPATDLDAHRSMTDPEDRHVTVILVVTDLGPVPGTAIPK